MSIIMTSFSDRFLHYGIINYHRNTTICWNNKISMLFFFISTFHIRPDLRSNFCYSRRLRLEHFKMVLCILNVFWIEGWGSRNIDDEKCAKMPNFSCIKKVNTCLNCCSCKLIIYNEYLVYIYNLDFPLINWPIPYFIILISNRANFAVRGPRSLSYM